MEEQELSKLLADNDIKAIVEKVKAALPYDFGAEERLMEYEPKHHAVFDKQKRKDKIVQAFTGVYDNQGKPITTSDTHKVNRIAFAGQKLIVSRRSMFVTGAGIELDAKPEKGAETDLFEMVTKTVEDTKLAFKWGPIFQASEAEGECVALFHLERTKPIYWGKLAKESTYAKLQMAILKPSNGFKFFPVFDVLKNMVAFGISYSVKVGDEDQEWFDLYTQEEIRKFRKGKQNDWVEYVQTLDKLGIDGKPIEFSKKHGFDRIPIGYFPSYQRMWQDQQAAIDRLEFLFSVHGDINDYNGSPLLVGVGEVQNVPPVGEAGKFFVLGGEGASLKYVTWDSAPESIKYEIENLLKNLYVTSRTPNISFEEVKGIGAISGAALELLFLDAHAAAKDHQDGAFGENCQRVLNIIKYGIGNMHDGDNPVDAGLSAAAQSLSLKPKFEPYMPKNRKEHLENQQLLVNTLVTALERELISIETAVKALPPDLVPDPDAELIELLKLVDVRRKRVDEENVTGF